MTNLNQLFKPDSSIPLASRIILAWARTEGHFTGLNLTTVKILQMCVLPNFSEYDVRSALHYLENIGGAVWDEENCALFIPGVLTGFDDEALAASLEYAGCFRGRAAKAFVDSLRNPYDQEGA